jgi:hypothetical protein
MRSRGKCQGAFLTHSASELREEREVLTLSDRLSRAASSKQNERHERSFWTHFPDAGRALEACDKTLAQRESARPKCATDCNGKTQHREACELAVLCEPSQP